MGWAWRAWGGRSGLRGVGVVCVACMEWVWLVWGAIELTAPCWQSHPRSNTECNEDVLEVLVVHSVWWKARSKDPERERSRARQPSLDVVLSLHRFHHWIQRSL
jgi:hypothetical protein